MSWANKARGKLTEARNELIRRRRQLSDPNEKTAIDDAIASLNDTVGLINQQALLEAAGSVVEATAGLERVVSSAVLGPFDEYVRRLEEIFFEIAALIRNGEIGEPLPRSPQEPPEPLDATTTPAGTPPEVIAGELPPLRFDHDFANLRSEYEAWFEAMTVRGEYGDKVNWHVEQLLKHENRYRDVGQFANAVPWSMVGVIHALECGFNFTGHLHNGDPLTSRTRNVPANRPPTGVPPYSWKDSALDALTMEGLNTIDDWSIPSMLFVLEKYNGFGYRNKRLPTPYLWSFSNLYEKGKYVADGRFEPEAVSRQVGGAVMIKALKNGDIDLT